MTPDDGAPGPEDGPEADEIELLAAFDRLRPQGSLQWGFDDAMRRLSEPGAGAGAVGLPWAGLPDDLWERGRSARIGQRFVGDVAGVLASILAADARAAADAAMDDRILAAWDALRYLAARMERLESWVDPVDARPRRCRGLRFPSRTCRCGQKRWPVGSSRRAGRDRSSSANPVTEP